MFFCGWGMRDMGCYCRVCRDWGQPCWCMDAFLSKYSFLCQNLQILFRGVWNSWDNLFSSPTLTDTNFWAASQKLSVAELSSSCVCSILPPFSPSCSSAGSISELLRLTAPSPWHFSEVAEDFAHLGGYDARLERLLVLMVIVKMNGCC